MSKKESFVQSFNVSAVFCFFVSSFFSSPVYRCLYCLCAYTVVLFFFCFFSSPPALAHHMRSLAFFISCFILVFFLSPRIFFSDVCGIFLFLSFLPPSILALFVFSAFLNILFASYILVFTCLTPRANAEGGDSS